MGLTGIGGTTIATSIAMTVMTATTVMTVGAKANARHLVAWLRMRAIVMRVHSRPAGRYQDSKLRSQDGLRGNM